VHPTLRLSKKAKPFLTKGLRPAAAHFLSACGRQKARLQAEMCFFRRTCRRKKQIKIFSRLRARTLRGFFDRLDREPSTGWLPVFIVNTAFIGSKTKLSPAFFMIKLVQKPSLLTARSASSFYHQLPRVLRAADIARLKNRFAIF